VGNVVSSSSVIESQPQTILVLFWFLNDSMALTIKQLSVIPSHHSSTLGNRVITVLPKL